MIAEPTIHMLKATMHPATRKVVVEPLRAILHVLNETLHQVTPQRLVDIMLQTQRAAGSRIPIRTRTCVVASFGLPFFVLDAFHYA
jgi:hypothetical protein